MNSAFDGPDRLDRVWIPKIFMKNVLDRRADRDVEAAVVAGVLDREDGHPAGAVRVAVLGRLEPGRAVGGARRAGQPDHAGQGGGVGRALDAQGVGPVPADVDDDAVIPVRTKIDRRTGRASGRRRESCPVTGRSPPARIGLTGRIGRSSSSGEPVRSSLDQRRQPGEKRHCDGDRSHRECDEPAGRCRRVRLSPQWSRMVQPPKDQGTMRWTGLPWIWTFQVVTSFEVPVPGHVVLDLPPAALLGGVAGRDDDVDRQPAAVEGAGRCCRRSSGPTRHAASR